MDREDAQQQENTPFLVFGHKRANIKSENGYISFSKCFEFLRKMLQENKRLLVLFILIKKKYLNKLNFWIFLFLGLNLWRNLFLNSNYHVHS